MSPLFGSQKHVKGRIFSAMKQYFVDDDWKILREEDELLFFLFRGSTEVWVCVARAREEQNQFIFYSILQKKVPPERRQAMAEFLTRANYGLILGNFEMDFRDGELRYKTSTDVEDGELSQAMIRNLVLTNILMMDRYLPGIKAVLQGAAPEAAIAQCE